MVSALSTRGILGMTASTVKGAGVQGGESALDPRTPDPVLHARLINHLLHLDSNGHHKL